MWFVSEPRGGRLLGTRLLHNSAYLGRGSAPLIVHYFCDLLQRVARRAEIVHATVARRVRLAAQCGAASAALALPRALSGEPALLVEGEHG